MQSGKCNHRSTAMQKKKKKSNVEVQSQAIPKD